jgi:beta-1,4-mannosyl-glycoprotein beta-1,4-N-acetylglucosaminyltransferase
MIIDCFPFSNELDLLEIRLNELSELVDVFVISEATLTMNGKPKPLYFNENKERFDGFLNRIEHLIVNDYTGVEASDPWRMVRWQKQQGMDLVFNKFHPNENDIVIFSDCDEIPKASALKSIMDYEWNLVTPVMPLFYYWMDCICTSISWYGGRWIRPQKRQSYKSIRYGKTGKRVRNAGWHFSYMGGADNIIRKIDGSAHTEYNKHPYNTYKHVKRATRRGVDLFERGKYEFSFDYNIDDLPQYVLQNMRKFKKHFHRYNRVTNKQKRALQRQKQPKMIG